MSSRVMSHFSAIISAARNCDTSWVPYRACHPGDPANGFSKPYGSPASIAALIGIALMFCTPPATTRSAGPRHHRLRGEVHGLLRRAALAVHGGAGHLVGEAGNEPARARDVARLRSDGVDTAEHDVVDRGRIDVDPVHQRADRMGAEVGRVHARERRLRAVRPGVRTASTM